MWKAQRKKAKQTKEECKKEVIVLKEQILKLKDVDHHTLTKFNQFPLSKNTRKALKLHKYYEPTLVQQMCLTQALQGHDVVADAKTGSGKTLAFVIPVVELLFRSHVSSSTGVAAIIVAPTRELAHQVHSVVRKVSQFHSFTSALMIGGQGLVEECHFINSFNIIVCTPGRLYQHLTESSRLNTALLQVLVLDEADLCLSMGFAEVMNYLLTELPADRQTMLFSATQTRDVKTLLRSGCQKIVYCSAHELTTTATPCNLKQSYTICEAHDKLSFLYSFLKYYRNKKIIVFMSTCKQVKFLTHVFSRLKLRMKVVSMHGCMKQQTRLQEYTIFQKEKKKAVMMATDIASRGLDFSDVNWVVHLDCPEDVQTYIHRAGRTARYFGDGDSLLLLTGHEATSMLQQLGSRKLPLEKLDVTGSHLENINARVEDLLLKEVELLPVAQRAFTAYLKNLHYMKDKSIFDVTSVDQDLLARSYGLLCTPQIDFVEQSLTDIANDVTKSETKSIAAGTTSTTTDTTTNKGATASSSSCVDPSESGSSSAAGQLGSKVARAFYKNDSVKQGSIVCKERTFADRFNELFVTVKERTGPLAVPPKDYSKYLAKKEKTASLPPLEDYTTSTKSCLTLTDMRAIVERNKAANKQTHKLKLKLRRRATKQKREAKRHLKQPKTDEDADDESGGDEEEQEEEEESDDELDPQTQQIIDELPDPDEIRRRAAAAAAGDIVPAAGAAAASATGVGAAGGDDTAAMSDDSDYPEGCILHRKFVDEWTCGKIKGRVSPISHMIEAENEYSEQLHNDKYCKRRRQADSDPSTDEYEEEEEEEEEEERSPALQALTLADQERLALRLLGK